MAYAAVGALATLALPLVPPLQSPFPFATLEDRGAAGVALGLLPDVLSTLDGRSEVTFTGVPLPGADTVDLVLERRSVAAADALLWVDGSPHGPLSEAAVSLWAGAVAGHEGSDVFLALSPHGSRGWISTAAGTHHLVAGPGASGGWTNPTARLVPDATLRAEGHQPDFRCASDQLRQPATPALPIPQPVVTAKGTSPDDFRVLEALVAVESDSQYYDVFEDLDASSVYALTLFGAVSDRYLEDIRVVLSLSYLALYTDTSLEPWTAADNGGICVDQLFEYQGAVIAGDVEARGHLFHFLSGGNLGCGVAFLPGLCDPFFKFSVSGNIEGLLEFPVEQGPLNWDFIVVAHEIGHNFGAPHTHDWCPPVDECAPDWAGYGRCQDEQVCLSDASVMSYCHLCPGGYDNINLHFHDVSRHAMRETAENTCLGGYDDAPATSGGATAVQRRQ